MIRYNGLMVPCFLSPEGPGQLGPHNQNRPCPSGTTAVTRLEMPNVLMHVCKAHEHIMDTAKPSYIKLTGDDRLDGSSADPASLFQAPWILEINGLTRAAFLASQAKGDVPS